MGADLLSPSAKLLHQPPEQPLPARGIICVITTRDATPSPAAVGRRRDGIAPGRNAPAPPAPNTSSVIDAAATHTTAARLRHVTARRLALGALEDRGRELAGPRISRRAGVRGEGRPHGLLHRARPARPRAVVDFYHDQLRYLWTVPLGPACGGGRGVRLRSTWGKARGLHAVRHARAVPAVPLRDAASSYFLGGSR